MSVDEHASTYIPVTPRDGDGGKEGRKEGGGGSPGGGSTRPGARAHARGRMVAAAGAITHGVHLRRVSRGRTKTPAATAAPDIHETATGAPRHFWRDGPAPAADLAAYTASGAWVRGDQNWALEWGGKAYGYLFALPLTLALGFLIWSSQRFHRAATLAVVVTVLWVTFPSWGDTAAQPSSPAVASQSGATP